MSISTCIVQDLGLNAFDPQQMISKWFLNYVSSMILCTELRLLNLNILYTFWTHFLPLMCTLLNKWDIHWLDQSQIQHIYLRIVDIFQNTELQSCLNHLRPCIDIVRYLLRIWSQCTSMNNLMHFWQNIDPNHLTTITQLQRYLYCLGYSSCLYVSDTFLPLLSQVFHNQRIYIPKSSNGDSIYQWMTLPSWLIIAC
jgi:hypothetical protein